MRLAAVVWRRLKAKWQELGTFAVGQKAEITDAHKTLGRMCSKKRRKNSSRDRVSNFCSLW